MADPMWSGGPQQFQDRYPDTWAVLPDFMRAGFYPQDPPMSPLAMSGYCLLMTQVSIFGAFGGYDFGQYQAYYGDAYRSSPPGSYTDTVPTVTVPTPYEPPQVLGPNYDYQLASIHDLLLTTLDFLGPWYAPDNLHVQIQAIEDTLATITGGGGGPSTRTDTARILAAIYYIAQLPFSATIEIDDDAILQAIADSQDALQISVNTLHSAMTTRFDTVDAEGETLEGQHQDILDAIAAGTPSTGGPPVWPGLAGVTLGAPQALDDQTVITAPMDGVLVNITTLPTKVGKYLIGGAYYDYKVGEVAFETDNGDLEPWQYLGFRQAIYTPKTMRQAAKVRFRVLAGASGTCRIWTVT